MGDKYTIPENKCSIPEFGPKQPLGSPQPPYVQRLLPEGERCQFVNDYRKHDIFNIS